MEMAMNGIFLLRYAIKIGKDFAFADEGISGVQLWTGCIVIKVKIQTKFRVYFRSHLITVNNRSFRPSEAQVLLTVAAAGYFVWKAID